MENTLQHTADWYIARQAKFTGSEMWKLLSKSGKMTQTAKDYIASKVVEAMISPRDYAAEMQSRPQTKEMQYGSELESAARDTYAYVTGNAVEEVGFISFSDGFGSSPDGLVGGDGCIEIKCPYNSVRHVEVLGLSTAEELKSARFEYYVQTQCHLIATGRKWCDFVSYDPRMALDEFRIKIIRITRDSEMIDSILRTLEIAIQMRKDMLREITNRQLDEYVHYIELGPRPHDTTVARCAIDAPETGC